MSLLWPILRHALSHPRRTAVVDDQRRYSYGQLLGGAMFTAEQMDAVTAAPHVGILLPTSGAFPMALLAAWLTGRVAVPLNYLLSRDELVYVIHDSDIDTIVSVPPILDVIGGRHVIPKHIRLLDLTQVDFSKFVPLRWPPWMGRDQLAAILYTSGTSGRPKGVMLSHRNFRTNVDAAIEHAQITNVDTFFGVLPQFHSFGLSTLTLLPLRAGAKVVYTARFVPHHIVDLIRKHRPDIFIAVPSMYGALLSVKGAGAPDFGSIRLAISGGEPLPDATFDQFRERFGLHILEGYGLTETAPMTNWSTPRHHRLHSVGPTLPGVRVITVDEENHLLPPDHEGEILIAGPNIMNGYYKQPQQTSGVFVDLDVPAMDDRTGGRAAPQHRRFFRSGDIGQIDKDGFLYITGRKKEMLIIGGENVFPRQIEDVLNRHTVVRDSAVIGQPDAMRGEVPIAFVELEDGQTFDEAELRSWCRQHLTQYKVPRQIRPIDKLPRNPTGKILRRALKNNP